MKWPSFFQPGLARRAPLAGLDIAQHQLTWVELAALPDRTWRLDRCLSEALEPGWVVAGHIDAFEQVAAALMRLVSASGIGTRQVALALPDAEVMTHRIKLAEPLKGSALRLRAQMQAEQDWSVSVDELCVDFGLCDNPLLKGGKPADLWVASARKDSVQDRLGLAEAAGLQPVVMEAASHAVRRALQGRPGLRLEGQKAAVILVALGTDDITWQVMRLDNCWETHEGSPRLSGSMASDEADLLARQEPGGLAERLARALRPFIADARPVPIDRIVLTGTLSAQPGLQSDLRQHLELDCVVAHPFEGLAMGPAVQQGSLSPLRLGGLTACGLAWRRFAS